MYNFYLQAALSHILFSNFYLITFIYIAEESSKNFYVFLLYRTLELNVVKLFHTVSFHLAVFV